jgi:probable selenium-dependent hydroxylase accessory protein YqeC
MLIETLDISPGMTISLVGAGGKTSLMLALAWEALERWGSALITTTTQIYQPRPGDFPPLSRGAPQSRVPPGTLVREAKSLEEALRLLAPLEREKGGGRLFALGRKPRRQPGKISGVPPGWVDEINQRLPGVVMAVEADGAAHRALKAPAPHEPVIPASCRLVLAVAGMDALGRPLGHSLIHRPGAVSALTGAVPGEPVTPGVMATALWHSEGCGRGRPPASRLVPVLNKVDNTDRLEAAREVAHLLMAKGAPLVLLTSCLRWPIVVEAVRP